MLRKSAYDRSGLARTVFDERLDLTADEFRVERDLIAIGPIHAGDVIILICRGPMGAGMEEIYQVTSALKHLPFGKHVAVITDARFSGVSTGACIGHVGPEAVAERRDEGGGGQRRGERLRPDQREPVPAGATCTIAS